MKTLSSSGHRLLLAVEIRVFSLEMFRRGCSGKGKGRGRFHEDCYDSSSPGSSGSSSPTLAPRRIVRAATCPVASTRTSDERIRLSNGVRATRLLRTRVGSSGSGGDSPRSLDTPRMRSGLSSPLRPSRQATSSPGDDLSDDSGIRLDKGLYQNMFQDVINIKTLLLRLKRVLQDGDASNPFDNSLKNGLCYSVASNDTSSAEDTPTKTKDAERISDLKRQVVFQQHQIEEKERLIQALQAQVAKYEQTETSVPTSVETCNAATQTERVRPLSTGPSLLSGIPSDNPGGSLVSNTSESWSRSLPRQNDNKTNTLSSRVPVGPWRRTANANTEQTTTRKFLNTPIPQRRSSHPKTS